MQTRLKAFSDVASVALYDPEALPAGLEELWGDDAEKAIAEGRLLEHLPGGDGEVCFEVFVDEEPVADVRVTCSTRVKSALLRVPSGELWFTGAEYRIRSGSPKDRDNGTSVRVPPGNYEVEVLEPPIDTEETEVEKAVEDGAGRRARTAEGCVGTIIGLGVFMSVMAIPALIGFGIAAGSFKAFLRALLWVLAGAVVFWAIMIPIYRMQRFEGVRGIRKAAQETQPTTMVILRRLPDDADVSKMKGASFEPDYSR